MTKPDYQPDSVSQLRSALTEACAEHDVLRAVDPTEIRNLVDVLSAEQFADSRKRAQQELRTILDDIATRLVEEDRLAN